MNKDLKDIKLFMFDLDGTIYRDSVLIGNVKDTLNKIREKGARIVYLTNNSSLSNKEYVKRLSKIGILENDDLIYSSFDCTLDFLKEKRKGKVVYPLATKKVISSLKKSGIKIAKDNQDVDVVLLTLDNTITYDKIKKANELLAKGKEYICTHPDLVCPSKTGFVPDAGTFIETLKACSGRTPDIVLGKPYGYMADFLMKKYNIERDKIAMVGDRLYTDIQFGINAGFKTIVVLTGETTLEMAKNSPLNIDFCLSDVNEISNMI